MSKKTIPVYTEEESFDAGVLESFYISSYADDEREALERVAPHRHTYHEIILVFKGKGSHTIDFVDYEFTGPCLFLIHPQNIHTIRKDCPTEGGVIKFNSSIFAADDSESNFIVKYAVFDDIDVLPVINLTESQSENIQQIFRQLYLEYEKNGAYALPLLGLYLKIFLLKIYEIKKAHIPSEYFNDHDYKRFKVFQQELETNFNKHHEVGYYAAQLFISPKTLFNLVQKFTGKSPAQVITDRILLEAKRLIYHSDLTVKQIAEKLGFADSAYFNRYFKKVMKVSPGAYRRTVSDSFS
jgi:AraC-like DNA-binding protein